MKVWKYVTGMGGDWDNHADAGHRTRKYMFTGEIQIMSDMEKCRKCMHKDSCVNCTKDEKQIFEAFICKNM